MFQKNWNQKTNLIPRAIWILQFDILKSFFAAWHKTLFAMNI